MEEDNGINGALATAIEAGKALTHAEDRVVDLKFTEHGEEHSTSIVFVINDDGTTKVQALDDIEERARNKAREERLRFASGPDRRSGVAEMQSISSLISHALRFRDEDSTVWADEARRRMVVVLDYHKQGSAGATRWGEHRSVYNCPLSDAWKAWGGVEGLALSQDDLAALLDARDRDLAEGKLPNGKPAPTPSTLISIASSLETYAGQKVKRERDPQTGRVKLGFSSESGFSGDLIPPPSFLIEIPVFVDSEPEVLEVRWRSEVSKDGVACFTISIHAAKDVLRDAFLVLVGKVGAETALPVFIGTPEATK